MRPEVTGFFDEATNTISYVAVDPATRKCAVIDSVLDYDPSSGRTDRRSADRIIAFVRAHGLEVEWVLETHVHADHLSAAPYIKQQLGGRLAIGAEIRTVQNVFGKIFNAGTDSSATAASSTGCSTTATASGPARSRRWRCTRRAIRPPT